MRLVDVDELIKFIPTEEIASALAVMQAPTVDAVERKKGKWLDKKVIDDRKDAKIQQWQQARCSICDKWHTVPYMYYFSNYNFCPNCGADMRGEQNG